MYELVQQMGRADRVGTDAAGTNTYEVHIDLNSYVSLYVRIMQCDCERERRVQLRQMHEVLSMLVLPKNMLSCARPIRTYRRGAFQSAIKLHVFLNI